MSEKQRELDSIRAEAEAALREVDDEIATKDARISSLEQRVKELEEIVKTATEFTLQRRGIYVGEPRETVKLQWRGDDQWCITNDSAVLNTYGEWESEPLPSSRGDEFKARSRFSLDDAWKIAREYLCHATDPRADSQSSAQALPSDQTSSEKDA